MDLGNFGRPLDDFSDFGGELPDDEEFEKTEIDANNDETFGGDVATLDDPDLDSYANQSVELALQREFESLWKDENGGAATGAAAANAPDPATVPFPMFNFDESFQDKSSTWSSSNGLFNLWSDDSKDNKLFSFSEDSSGSAFTDYLNAHSVFGMSSTPVKQQQHEITPGAFASRPTDKMPPLRPSDMMGAAPILPPAALSPQAPVQPPIAPIGSSQQPQQPSQHPPAALSAEDLERRLIEESRKAAATVSVASAVAAAAAAASAGGAPRPPIHPALAAMFTQAQAANQRGFPMPLQQLQQAMAAAAAAAAASGAGVPPPSAAPPHHVPPPQQPQRPAPQFPPMLMQVPPEFRQFIPIWLEVLHGKIKYLPRGVPPIHPVVVQMVKNFTAHGQPGPAPGGQGPPPMGGGAGGMRPPSGSPAGMPPMHMNRPGYHMFSPMHNTDYWRRFVRKPPGMPSGKTIEDFAFEPYAGFMSKKEREWLIKIQTLQCMGYSGPYQDDYYYTMWRQREMAKLQQAEAGGGGRNGSANGASLSKKKEMHHRSYESPKFMGSLGKPTSSTTTNPRHLIDVSCHSDSLDDDVSSVMGGTKKPTNLRALLLAIENGAILVLECEDLKREIMNGSPTVNDSEITDRIDRLLSDLFNAQFLPKVLQFPKGRRLFLRAVDVALPTDQRRILNVLVNAAGRVSEKAVVEISSELVPSLVLFFSSWPREELVALTQSLTMPVFYEDLNNKCPLSRDILLSILYACSRSKAHSQSLFFNFLRGVDSPDWKAFQPSSKMWCTNSRLSRDEILMMADWLRLLAHGNHCAARLANTLTAP